MTKNFSAQNEAFENSTFFAITPVMTCHTKDFLSTVLVWSEELPPRTLRKLVYFPNYVFIMSAILQ